MGIFLAINIVVTLVGILVFHVLLFGDLPILTIPVAFVLACIYEITKFHRRQSCRN